MNKQLSKVIDTMADIDQNVRFLGVKNKTAELNIYNFLIYAIDLGHNHKIKKLIEEYGFPTSKVIGKKSLKKFWLLVQHQDLDVSLQESCLLKCGFESTEYKHLEDRILINKGKFQLHGTQNKLEK